MTPAFTVLIGSIGRATLMDTLNSIQRQVRAPGDQCIVAIDTFEDDDHARERRVTSLVKSYGKGFIPVAYNSGYHWLGVEQINYALRTVPITGSHLFTLGDDDVFIDRAYATLRPIIQDDPTRPILYKFVSPVWPGFGYRELLWDRPEFRIGRISGCCIAAPKEFVKPMTTEKIVEHDYYWMKDILEASGRDPLWLDDVLVIARPEPYETGKARGHADVKHRGVVRCWHCKTWRWAEDVNILDHQCPKCGFVIQLNEPRRVEVPA